MEKFVYSFNEGSKDMCDLLGLKGANLAEMTQIGLPVPFGFTISTEACKDFFENEEEISEEIANQIFNKLEELETVTGRKLGDVGNPLLLSVRSGAVISMPGMLDTILNLGLNDATVESIATVSGNRQFALDSYKRFMQRFSEVVFGNEGEDFENIEILQDPKVQLLEAVKGLFRAWNSENATIYRRVNNIPNDMGTAITIQSMAFGNFDEESGTGVLLTRNPLTGEKEIYGEFLVNAQGEDMASGAKIPHKIEEIENYFPNIKEELKKISNLLELHFKEMQDIEFTIQKNKLYILQCKSAKRSAKAAVKVAVEMQNEGLIDKETAITRVSPYQVSQLLYPVFLEKELEEAESLASGIPASLGASSGRICLSVDVAQDMAEQGEDVILVRKEASLEDFVGMVHAKGFVTAKGGMTSHAAVVARGMGKSCIVGCENIEIDREAGTVKIGNVLFREGDFISIDGSTGHIYGNIIRTVMPEFSEDFNLLMKWADDIRSLKIRTNVDNLDDAKVALKFGADGIGLCRTEHMFFDEKKMLTIRKCILSQGKERESFFRELMNFQKKDFKDLFKLMEDRPVTIRLLDSAPRDFLPSSEKEIRQLGERAGIPFVDLVKRIEGLAETNPRLGNRGCRTAVIYPEIAAMQAEAAIMAAIELKKESDINVIPELLVPLVSMAEEYEKAKETIVNRINKCFEDTGITVNYLLGVMIEVPRAALIADSLAKSSDFFSFGTNDLTQMTFGFSRDDAGRFVKKYKEMGIIEADPFQIIDKIGVGKLIETAISLGKTVKPNIKFAICGEQSSDPETIEFCQSLGMSYVSCSPYKVPIARLAAAQAAIAESRQ